MGPQTQANAVTFTLASKNPACTAAGTFLLNGKLWWAAYGSTASRLDACCGANNYGISQF